MILTHFICYSQELKNKFGENYYTPGLYKTEYHAAEGTPYLEEQFKPAKINDLKEIQLVRFDAYKDQVEIMTKGNSVMILDDSEPYVIAIQDGSKDVYKTKSYLDDKGTMKYTFFKQIHDGDDFELFLKEEIKFYKEVKTQAYQESQPAQFKKERSRFFVSDFAGDKNPLVALPDRLNKFVGLFTSRSKEMKEYIKREKLDINKQDDLILILSEYFGKYNPR